MDILIQKMYGGYMLIGRELISIALEKHNTRDSHWTRTVYDLLMAGF